MNWNDYSPNESELRAEVSAAGVLLVVGALAIAGAVAAVGWLVWRVIGG